MARADPGAADRAGRTAWPRYAGSAQRSTEPRPQLEHGLGVDLAHPALGYTEYLTDLGQRQALVVVEREHDLFPIAEAVDSPRQQLLHLLDLEGRHRAVALVGDGVHQRGRLAPLAVATGKDLVQGDETDEGDLVEDLLQLVLADPQLLGDLGVVGRAQQLRLQLGVGPLDGPGLGPHRPGHPVDRAQLVDDGALDPGDGVGLELDVARRVELLDGVDQPKDPIADQVRLLDAVREPRGDPAGDVLHQRGVVDDQAVPRALIASCLELAPQILDGAPLLILAQHVISLMRADGSSRTRRGGAPC